MEPTELEVTDSSYWANKLDALERLEKNPDFQEIILNGYLKEKVLDSMTMLANPSVKQHNQRPDVMEDLVAASNLNYFLFMIKQLGAGARQDIADQLEIKNSTSLSVEG